MRPDQTKPHMCLFVVVVALVAAAAAVTGRSAAGTGESPAQPRQVIKQTEVMKLFFDPYYADLRRAIQEEPQERADWRALYVATYRLAEVTNLLYFREGRDYLESAQWNRSVAEAQEITLELGKSVTSLDYPLARKNYERLIQSCNDCHTRFEPRKPTAVEL